MVRVKVKEPEGDVFFSVLYRDDHPYEIRQFDVSHHQRIKDSLIASARHYLGQQDYAGRCEIANHVGKLCLVPDIQDEEEALDILADDFHSYHWFELDDDE
jgi:hypothetical protein